jgi:hypothetical protein
MPLIKDGRINDGKKNRNKAIREHFARRFNDGIRYEVIMDELIHKFGLSESTINQIIKGYGNYKDE